MISRVGDIKLTAPDKVKTVFGFEDEIIHRYLGGWHGLKGGGFYFETRKLMDGRWPGGFIHRTAYVDCR
jgi:hypothetical protein